MRRWAGLAVCLTFCPFALLAMTSADAVKVILNSKNAIGVKTFAAAKEMVERDAADGKPLQQFVVGVTTDDKTLSKRYLDASRGKIRELAERTKKQDGYTLPDIYSIVREGFNITEVTRPAWWFFGSRGKTISICATKKAWKAVTNTYRPYV